MYIHTYMYVYTYVQYNYMSLNISSIYTKKRNRPPAMHLCNAYYVSMTYPINCSPVSSLANAIAQSLYSYIPLCDINLKQTMPYRLQLMACIKCCTYTLHIYISTLLGVLSMLALHIPPACSRCPKCHSQKDVRIWPLGTCMAHGMLPCAQGRVELLWLTIYIIMYSYRLNSSPLFLVLRFAATIVLIIISYRKPCFT